VERVVQCKEQCLLPLLYMFAYPVHRYQYLPGLFTVTDAARIGKPENRAAYMVARAARPSPVQMYCGPVAVPVTLVKHGTSAASLHHRLYLT